MLSPWGPNPELLQLCVVVCQRTVTIRGRRRLLHLPTVAANRAIAPGRKRKNRPKAVVGFKLAESD